MLSAANMVLTSRPLTFLSRGYNLIKSDGAKSVNLFTYRDERDEGDRSKPGSRTQGAGVYFQFKFKGVF